MNTNNLLSGFLGAVVGAVAAYWVMRFQIVATAKERLIFLLLSNGHTIHYPPTADRKASFYDDTIAYNIAEAHRLYFTIRNSFFRCKRRRLDEAWNQYGGAEFGKNIPKSEPSHLFQRGPHTRESAQNAIIKLVAALTYG